MITTTLKDFLEQGRLGSIVPGVTKKDDIRSWLGDGGNVDEPPKRWPKRGRSLFTHWGYGLLELAFDYDTLISIAFPFYLIPNGDTVELPDKLLIEGYFPTTDTDLDEFVAYLDSEGLAHQIDPIWSFEDRLVTLAVGSAEVRVSFFANTKKIEHIGTEPVLPPE